MPMDEVFLPPPLFDQMDINTLVLVLGVCVNKSGKDHDTQQHKGAAFSRRYLPLYYLFYY
jgi:hypothetical protein